MIYNFNNIIGTNVVNNKKSINEIYIGESKEIKEMLECISIFRKRHMENYYFNTKVSVDPEILKFNRLVEEYWGFGRFALVVKPGQIMNAMTIPLGYRLDYSAKKHISSRKGFKYDKKDGNSTIVWIYAGIILNPIFTDRECLAIILHEIGHNFEATIDNFVALYYMTSKILLFPFAITSILNGPAQMLSFHNKSYNWYIDFIEDMKKDNKPLAEIMNCIESYQEIILKLSTNINFFILLLNPLAVISSIGQKFISEIVHFLLDIFSVFKFITLGSKGEIISDTFVTMYGYESDLVTCFNKIENNGMGVDILESANKDPVLGFYVYTLLTPYTLISRIFDPHPSDAARFKQQLYYLKRELQKEDIDPSMRKEIEGRIVALEKNIDNALKINDGYYGTLIPKTVQKITYVSLTKGLRGKLHDRKLNNIFDKIDRAVEKE